MYARLALMTILILALGLLSGCPNAENALLGQWAYINDGVSYGLTLSANGQASSFPLQGFNATLPGTLTWEVKGDKFVMNQVHGSGRVIYCALLDSNINLKGVWMEWTGASKGASQEWVANKM